MTGREFKDEAFRQFARLGGAFSSPKRIEILDLLAQGERPVEAIARESNLTLANASRHLQVLRAANLVAARKDGPQSFYRLSGPEVLRGCHALRALAEDRLAEVGRLAREYFSSMDGLEPVGFEEVRRRAGSGEVVVLDVRPRVEYGAGHVDGAISIPLGELAQRLSEIPKGAAVVAYCRGPYCVLAAEAVRVLRGSGYTARRLVDGYPEWQAAGLPLKRGAEGSETLASDKVPVSGSIRA